MRRRSIHRMGLLFQTLFQEVQDTSLVFDDQDSQRSK